MRPYKKLANALRTRGPLQVVASFHMGQWSSSLPLMADGPGFDLRLSAVPYLEVPDSSMVYAVGYRV